MVEKSKGLAAADGPALRVAPPPAAAAPAAAAGFCSSAGAGSSVLTVAVFSSAQTAAPPASFFSCLNSQIAQREKIKQREERLFPTTDLEQPCRWRPGRKQAQAQAQALLPLVGDEAAEEEGWMTIR
jgi:hypothetical protein